MDSLTHLLVGHAMGAAASTITHPYGAAAYWAVLIGNSLPDIDIPLSLLWRRDIKLHRTVTHTLPGAILLSGLIGLIMHLLLPGTPLAVTFLWTLLGSLAHMGMDCLNLFGARPFWPFSGRWIEAGILHILDPILLLLLGVPALLAGLGVGSEAVLAGSFFLIWPYVLYRAIAARSLIRSLRAERPLRARVVPWYSGWRYIAETESTIEFGRWLGGERRVMERFTKQDSPLIQATLTHPDVARFLRFAEYPYAVVEADGDGHSVIWGDMVRKLRADFQPLRVKVET